MKGSAAGAWASAAGAAAEEAAAAEACPLSRNALKGSASAEALEPAAVDAGAAAFATGAALLPFSRNALKGFGGSVAAEAADVAVPADGLLAAGPCGAAELVKSFEGSPAATAPAEAVMF